MIDSVKHLQTLNFNQVSRLLKSQIHTYKFDGNPIPTKTHFSDIPIRNNINKERRDKCVLSCKVSMDYNTRKDMLSIKRNKGSIKRDDVNWKIRSGDSYEVGTSVTRLTEEYYKLIEVTDHLPSSVEHGNYDNVLRYYIPGMNNNLIGCAIVIEMKERDFNGYLRQFRKAQIIRQQYNITLSLPKALTYPSAAVEHIIICRSVLEISETLMVTRKSELTGLGCRDSNDSTKWTRWIIPYQTDYSTNIILPILRELWLSLESKKIGADLRCGLKRALSQPYEMMGFQPSSHSILITN